jgi:hypothetical protein
MLLGGEISCTFDKYTLAGLADTDRGLSKGVRREKREQRAGIPCGDKFRLFENERVPCPNLSPYLRRLAIFRQHW